MQGYGSKDQQNAMSEFRAGRVNVLVSTSVGEEGIDVGEVDLIVCYDTSGTTSVMQRSGRTGRKVCISLLFLELFLTY